MSRYNAPFCSDEELLEELSKLGYDDVSPDVFNKMKDDLSELLEKEEDHLDLAGKERNDPPVSEYEYSDVYSLSSKILSSSGSLVESRSSQETASRKVKRKSHKLGSHLSKDGKAKQGIERSMSENGVVSGLGKKSSLSLQEHASMYKDEENDVLTDLRNSPKKHGNDNTYTSNDNDSIRKSRVSNGKNKNVKYSNRSKSFPSKENDIDVNHCSTSDKECLSQTSSVTKHKSKAKKESNSTVSLSKSQSQDDTSDIQDIKNDNFINSITKSPNLEENFSESNNSSGYKISDFNLNSSSSSGSSEKKVIKRKVLRRRNGKSVITEELVEAPFVFETSYPESDNLNSSKSFSSDDLSYKSNNSTGSVAAISPETSIKSSTSTLSLLSSRTTTLRVSNTRKKKSDPVAMYNYYRKFWDSFKPPGENKHDRLRWAVRDKMLEYHI